MFSGTTVRPEHLLQRPGEGPHDGVEAATGAVGHDKGDVAVHRIVSQLPGLRPGSRPRQGMISDISSFQFSSLLVLHGSPCGETALREQQPTIEFVVEQPFEDDEFKANTTAATISP